MRELLVARIISGCVRIHLSGATYLVKKPSRESLYEAQEVYLEHLEEAALAALFDEDDLYDHLIDTGIWDEESDKLLKTLPKEVEEFKVKLFKSNFRSNEKKVVRAALKVAKEKVAELEARRHSQDHVSCIGYASLARARFTMARSLFATDGLPAFPAKLWEEGRSDLLDAAMAAYAASRLDEATYRDLARNEPWTSLWGCRRATTDIFGVPAADFTDEQKSLVSFAQLYDNIREHPECPSDEVIEDDDLLDGWLIDQRRQRKKEGAGKADSLISNEKIRGAQEVFLIADTAEDAEGVMSLNDDHARSVQRRRFSALNAKGSLNEAEMPDQKQKIQMMKAQMEYGARK